MSKRIAITVFEDDTAITLMKPILSEYQNQVFVIFEDAYGEISGSLKSIDEIKKMYGSLIKENLQEILSELNILP